MVKKIIIALFALFVINLSACKSTFGQAPYFKNIDFDLEKKGTRLLKIFQDRRGIMWLGTNWGLCRYDGINFKYLDKDSVEVSAIGESNNGVLWIGHVNGEIEFVNNLTIEKFTPAHSLPKRKITAILFDKLNRLWIGTYGAGLYCFDKDSLSIFNSKEGLTDDNIYGLCLSEDGAVWAATDMGISICRLAGAKKEIGVINQQSGLPDNIVRSLRKDAEGNMWIALQDKGVCFVEKSTGTIKIPPETRNWTYGQVNDILPLKRELFIGTEENGIIEIHFGLPALNKMIPVKKKKFSFIQQLLPDNNEQVWVVSDNSLSIANCNHFQVIEVPVEWQETIKAITTDSTGRIWFANRKGLFTKKDNNSAIEKVNTIGEIDYSSIVCLYSDYNNTIWIGTYNNGLFHYNPHDGSLQQFNKASGITDNNVFSICGSGSEIWLGTLGGATKMDIFSTTPRFENFTRENGLNNNYVYNVAMDRNNNKWFATDGSGITRLTKSGFQHFYPIAGLEKNIVYTTTEDIYGNIWFTGLNSGLFVFDGQKFKRYTIKNGLHDNEILNVVADNKGNLILSHPDGLELFSIRKELFTFYGAESGFDNIRPQMNAYCKTPKDAILIAGTDKIIQYYPADARYTQLPRLVMNDVMVYFKSIGIAGNARLEYNENHVTFDYAGLWYIHPEAINYQYLLEGYSKGWVVTRDHIITFPNLPPGNYTLRVKTSINDDYRYSPDLVYHFRISKPFWKTAWFIALVFITIGLLLYYFVRLRIQVIRYEQEKDKQKYIAQLAVLKNQLNPHFLFNSFNTLMNIIDKDKGMAIEYAEKLSDFYREILVLQDQEVVTIREELNLLQDYVYLQRKRFGDNLRLKLNITESHLEAGIPPLTLQLLVENALKHNIINDDKPLFITIESVQSFLIVSNNINAHEKNTTTKSAGIGLKNIQQRVLLLTGKEIKIINTKDEFNVIIPINK